MRFPLVALDIDGTVVDGEDRISPAVQEAVDAVVASGRTVMLSTGRAIPGVTEVAERLGIADGLAVASNGAVVFRYEPFEVVHTETFDAAPAVNRIIEAIPDAIVGVEDVGVGFRVNRHLPDLQASERLRVEPLEALMAEPAARVVVRAPDHDREEFARLVADLGLVGTNYYVGYTAWLDLAPEGVSKASGLDVVCGMLGLTAADVLAVGDGNNDVEMLAWAGRGVAMGQAPDDVKAAADAVTGTIAEDGLATELRALLAD